jgi:hypothetical protein
MESTSLPKLKTLSEREEMKKCELMISLFLLTSTITASRNCRKETIYQIDCRALAAAIRTEQVEAFVTSNGDREAVVTGTFLPVLLPCSKRHRPYADST